MMICSLFILSIGILTIGNGLDTRSSPFNIRVWDSANTLGNKTNNNPFNSSSSSIIRARMEVSSSSNISGNGNSSPRTSSYSKTSTNSIQPQNLKDSKIGIQIRNKPLLNSLVNKLEMISSKLDHLTDTQVQIQKSFDNLESRYSFSATMDDVPQCGKRVDSVLRTLTPLVSRVEGIWNIIGSGKSTSSITNSPSQYLQNDPLLSESRRQERAISAIRSDLNIRSQQIMSELGTVEHQLELLQGQSAFRQRQPQPQPPPPPPPSGGPAPGIDQPDQFDADIRVTNDVTFQPDPSPSNGTYKVPSVVFPSVKNKPILDLSVMDGPDALLTGSGQTGTSCADLMSQGNKRSGLYHVRLPGARSSFWQLLTYCEQESAGGGWTVIQRRADFGEPRESFHRNWVEYRSGFGDPLKELWMGNLNLHLLTNAEDQVLRIELEDFDGEKRFAEYSTFKVASESDGFRLEVSGYSGDAGDALSDPWYGAHGSAFSTHDRDNDRSSLNCASMLKGGWWWKSCGRGLNGIYFDAPQPDSALARQGIVWFRWKGWDYNLRKATMMIRPKIFRPQNGTQI